MKRRNSFNWAKLLLLLALATPLSSTQAQSQEAQVVSTKDYLYVPILIATDRYLAPIRGKIRFSDTQLDPPRLNFAVETEPVHPPIGCKIPTTLANSLNWSIVGEDSSNAENARIENVTLTKDEALARAKTMVERQPDGKVLLYVHGCCCDHVSATNSAALAALWYGMPVISYDWCSIPWDYNPMSSGGYKVNDTRNAIAKDRFTEFLVDLETKIPSDKIVIIAHSMGNKLVDAMLMDRYNKYGANQNHPKFAEVVMSNADIPVEQTSGHLDKIVQNTNMFRILVNDSDAALLASTIVQGGTRLGAPHQKLQSLLKTEGVQVIDHKKTSTWRHDFPFWLSSDLSKTGTVDPVRRCKIFQSKTSPRMLSVGH